MNALTGSDVPASRWTPEQYYSQKATKYEGLTRSGQPSKYLRRKLFQVMEHLLYILILLQPVNQLQYFLRLLFP